MTNVHDAVLSTLRTHGTDILKDSIEFKDLIIDQLDSTSKERKALEIGCDSKFLEALSGVSSKDELSAAAKASATYLTDSYVMDPEVATSVSYEIASAIAEFLGVDAPSADRKKLRTAKKGSFGAPGIIALVLSLSLLVAGLYAAHLNPIFGCTLFPSSGKLASISCEWYGSKDSAGSEFTLLFLENNGEETVRMALNGNSALEGTPLPKLASGESGLMVLHGIAGITDVRTKIVPQTKEDVESSTMRQIGWSYRTDDRGMVIVYITNPTDERIRIYPNSIMLASKGISAKCCAFGDVDWLEPGTTTINFTKSARPLTLHSANMALGNGTDLYLNGVKVPLNSN